MHDLFLLCVAETCLQEYLDVSNNAGINCQENNNGDLTCDITCTNGYAFQDGTAQKTYTCTGENVWSPSQTTRTCVCKYMYIMLFLVLIPENENPR